MILHVFRKSLTISSKYPIQDGGILHKAYKSLVAAGISPRSVSPRTDVTLEKWQLACDFIEDENFKVILSSNSKHVFL